MKWISGGGSLHSWYPWYKKCCVLANKKKTNNETAANENATQTKKLFPACKLLRCSQWFFFLRFKKSRKNVKKSYNTRTKRWWLYGVVFLFVCIQYKHFHEHNNNNNRSNTKNNVFILTTIEKKTERLKWISKKSHEINVQLFFGEESASSTEK